MFRTLITTLLAAVLATSALNAFAAADVNQASQAELETVKGIGPGLSGKIVKARETGQFKNWADLVDRVGGIGSSNAAKLSQGGLTVAGAAYDGSATAPAKGAKASETAKAPKEGSPAKKAKKAAEAA